MLTIAEVDLYPENSNEKKQSDLEISLSGFFYGDLSNIKFVPTLNAEFGNAELGIVYDSNKENQNKLGLVFRDTGIKSFLGYNLKDWDFEIYLNKINKKGRNNEEGKKSEVAYFVNLSFDF